MANYMGFVAIVKLKKKRVINMEYTFNLENNFLIIKLSGDLIGEENGPVIIAELEEYNANGNLKVIVGELTD